MEASRRRQLGESDRQTEALVEHRLRAGMLWALKWTMLNASESGLGTAPSCEDLYSIVMETGPAYESLVDALKLASLGLVKITVDLPKKILTIDQGEDQTGHDLSLVAMQWETNPIHTHVPLTQDQDQLTRRWTAGQFRKSCAWLGELAEQAETEAVVSLLLGVETPLFNRPVLLEIPTAANDTSTNVMEDLTMTPAKMAHEFWNIGSWLDVPVVQQQHGRFAVSDMLKALAGMAGNDYMLRIAARVDPEQYSKVSGLRESRMIDICTTSLQNHGWQVRPRFRDPGPPPREIDVLASKAGETIVFQLKSTLRPESPWEVFKRNEEIEKGIQHTAEVLKRFAGSRGFVVTDGYRGDFTTWKAAMTQTIVIATLRDVDKIARDPLGAADAIKATVGIGRVPPSHVSSLEGENDLLGWKLRIVGGASGVLGCPRLAGPRAWLSLGATQTTPAPTKPACPAPTGCLAERACRGSPSRRR